MCRSTWTILALAAAGLAVAFSIASPGLDLNNLAAQLNRLYPQHRVVLAKNPNPSDAGFSWVEQLQSSMPLFLHEFVKVSTAGSLALLPEKAYLSKGFQGGVDNTDTDTDTDVAGEAGGKSEWEWAMLRAGTYDTCLAAHFDTTIRVLDGLHVPVHTAFFSVLYPGKSLPPHCGETRALHRCIMVLGLLGEPGEGSGAGERSRMSVLKDHEMCMPRFAKSCPKDLARNGTHVETVEYGVGDVIVFNDFVCHWVENSFSRPRLALIINVERDDIPMWKRWLMRFITKAYMVFKGSKLRNAAEQACRKLEGV